MTPLTLLDGVTATGAGDAAQPSLDNDTPFENLPYQVIGTFVGTVAIEVSLDGTNWQSFATETAAAAGTIPFFPYVRGNVTAFTSGSVWLKIGY